MAYFSKPFPLQETQNFYLFIYKKLYKEILPDPSKKYDGVTLAQGNCI